jgi:hypothetical protein
VQNKNKNKATKSRASHRRALYLPALPAALRALRPSDSDMRPSERASDDTDAIRPRLVPGLGIEREMKNEQ